MQWKASVGQWNEHDGPGIAFAAWEREAGGAVPVSAVGATAYDGPEPVSRGTEGRCSAHRLSDDGYSVGAREGAIPRIVPMRKSMTPSRRAALPRSAPRSLDCRVAQPARPPPTAWASAAHRWRRVRSRLPRDNPNGIALAPMSTSAKDRRRKRSESTSTPVLAATTSSVNPSRASPPAISSRVRAIIACPPSAVVGDPQRRTHYRRPGSEHGEGGGGIR